MQLRKLVLACGFASFAWANFASALGLGEITLKSTLNEPLRAEVKLVDTRDLSSDQILVALASPADFERNGIDRLYFYTELQFQVVLDNPSGPIVLVTTRNSVREPYLNFLLEARWTAGRLLREYTVLMDLPTDDSPQQVLQPATTVTSRVADTTPAATPEPSEPSEQALERPVERAASVIDESTAPYLEDKPAVIAEQDKSAKKFEPVAGTYGPISKKDTLWEIAKAVRPDSSVSVHQTMLALQRLNPDAFIRGNINLIKKGKVLRVPDAAEVSSVSKSEALTQVAAQNTEWSGLRANVAANTDELGAQLDASRRTSRDRQEPEIVAGRVKLETPLSKDGSESGQGRGANKGGGKALESELSSTLEELDKSKFEKSELSSRVKDLEEQAQTMQKLTEASNEKLRAMQLNAAKLAEKKSASSKAAEPVVAEKPIDAAIPPAIQDQASSIASSVEASSIAASSVASPVKPVKRQAVVPAAAEKSILDTVLENLWIVLVAVGAIGVGIFVIRRRRVADVQPPLRSSDDSEDLFASEHNFDAFNERREEYGETQSLSTDDESTLFEEPETTAVAETGDVVGEADIYIAYGKFDQAEEMLLNGLSKDPQSSDIRLKLLEVYSQTQNAKEFDKHYAAILPHASESTKNRAGELRTNIAGISTFSGSSFSQQPPSNFSGSSSAVEEEFSFDLDDDVTIVKNDKTRIQSAPSNATTQRYNLDFDDSVAADETKRTSSIELDDHFSLELDPDKDAELGAGLEFDLDTDETEERVSDADDLSEISLALDSLDDEVLHEELEVPDAEEEFSFDFNELDADDIPINQKLEAFKVSPVADQVGDDFNLELDMSDVDLAALDQEMEGLDANLESLDFDDEPALQPAKSKFELASSDDDDGEEEIDWAEDEDDASDLQPVPTTAKAPTFVAQNVPTAEDDEDISDDVFDQALSDFSSDSLDVADDSAMSEDDLDSELDFMADADESATKLDLARAYIDMGDNDGARDILAEVAHEGNEQQRQEAVDLLSRIDV